MGWGFFFPLSGSEDELRSEQTIGSSRLTLREILTVIVCTSSLQAIRTDRKNPRVYWKVRADARSVCVFIRTLCNELVYLIMWESCTCYRGYRAATLQRTIRSWHLLIVSCVNRPTGGFVRDHVEGQGKLEMAFVFVCQQDFVKTIYPRNFMIHWFPGEWHLCFCPRVFKLKWGGQCFQAPLL